MADDKKTDSNELTELTGDLDLLGDWLDAKGYGEEAGLCTRVMDHMHKQDARIAELEAILNQIKSISSDQDAPTSFIRVCRIRAAIEDSNA